MQWRLIFTLILMVIVVIFSLANSAAVPFSYILGKKEISLALIIILSALVGAIAGVVAGLSKQFRIGRELEEKELLTKKLQRQVDDLKNETGAGDNAIYDQSKRPNVSDHEE